MKKTGFLFFCFFVFLFNAGQAKADTATTTLDISASDFSPYDGATTTVSVLQFDQDANGWVPAPDATVDFGWGATTTDMNGKADITATSSMPFSVSASKTNFLSSNSIDITPQVAHANITIRNGATVAFSGVVALPAANAVSVNITPTAGGGTVAVPARSLLSVLKTLDAARNEFAITDLRYYSYFDPPSFYINCITITAETNPLCGSWQYNLNGVYSWDGVDQALLENGDMVILYFGNQRQVSLSTTATTIGTSFIATAQKYDLNSSSYVVATGVTIGITQPNPNDLWNPLEIATSTVDANGQAVFTLNTAGTYNVGIKEDYYFPLTTLTITAPVSSSGGSVIIIPASGGGGSASAATSKIDLAKAADFLIAKQNADGSYNSAMLTDWSALALASVNPNGAAGQKIKNYLLADPDPLAGLNPVSDYARRAMALMSLNISPYDGVKTNYVKKIVDSFDGRQFGDVSLYNDDIFALLVLEKAGYSEADGIVKQAVGFVLGKQTANGSWSGVDLTAAAVQALKPLESLAGVSAALFKAKTFLAGAQGADGGFGNSFTTTWAMQAIAALGEEPDDWRKNGLSPQSFLAAKQAADGGLEKDDAYPDNRVWATAYALPAVQKKTWLEVMKSFAKPAEPVLLNELSGTNNSQLTATSTLEIAEVASSSPAVLNLATTTPTKADAEKVIESVKPAAGEKKQPPSALAAPAKVAAPKAPAGKISQLRPSVQGAVEAKEPERTGASAALIQPADNQAEEKQALGTKISVLTKKTFSAVTDTIMAGIFFLLKLLTGLL